MSRYPCGTCTIGVRHKGILCTGECGQWYHSKCLNWTDKMFKNLNKSEIESWKCGKCKTTINSSNSANSLEEIEQKILTIGNTEENNLENSLSLAAEVGNALLAENQELKQQITELTTTNAKLILEIGELNNRKMNNINYQSQLEELENEKVTILNRYSMLVEKLNQVENQLIKENKMRTDLEKIYEDSDREKEEIISKYERNVATLQNTIKQLKIKLSNDSNQNQSSKTVRHMETQTKNVYPNPSTEKPGNPVLTELVEIKARQDCMENSVKAIQEQLKNFTLSTNVAQKKPNSVVNRGSLSGKKKNLNKQINHRSISLQTAKFRAILTKNQPIPYRNSKTMDTSNRYILDSKTNINETNAESDALLMNIKTPIWSIGPPFTATKLSPSETTEEFYNKNIEKFKANYKNNTSPSFLVPGSFRKEIT